MNGYVVVEPMTHLKHLLFYLKHQNRPLITGEKSLSKASKAELVLSFHCGLK